jgi:hypothetical protein
VTVHVADLFKQQNGCHIFSASAKINVIFSKILSQTGHLPHFNLKVIKVFFLSQKEIKHSKVCSQDIVHKW